MSIALFIVIIIEVTLWIGFFIWNTRLSKRKNREHYIRWVVLGAFFPVPVIIVNAIMPAKKLGLD